MNHVQLLEMTSERILLAMHEYRYPLTHAGICEEAKVSMQNLPLWKLRREELIEPADNLLGFELEEKYCRIARERLKQEVMAL